MGEEQDVIETPLERLRFLALYDPEARAIIEAYLREHPGMSAREAAKLRSPLLARRGGCLKDRAASYRLHDIAPFLDPFAQLGASGFNLPNQRDTFRIFATTKGAR